MVAAALGFGGRQIAGKKKEEEDPAVFSPENAAMWSEVRHGLRCTGGGRSLGSGGVGFLVSGVSRRRRRGDLSLFKPVTYFRFGTSAQTTLQF